MSLFCRTAFPVDLSGLVSSADSRPETDDPVFHFHLCHEGTNGNGDHFTADELRDAYQSAVGQKVNLSHSQAVTDIVGGITRSTLGTHGNRVGIACEAELYPRESQHAALAYKLLKKGIIGHVSMECAYQSGTCSICGKTVRTKKDYCVHLKNYKGREYNGKPVFETLHGVRFSGLGLLSKVGADPDARITQVAEFNGGPRVDEASRQTGNPGKDPQTNNPTNPEIKRLTALVTQLQQENQTLKDAKLKAETDAQNLKKRVSELEAKEQAFARNQRAKALMEKITKQGFSFGTDAAQSSELKRLAGLDDAAFAIAEQTYQLFVGQTQAKPNSTATPTGNQTQANFRPADVEDTPDESLESELTNHLMAAWQSRQT